MGPRPAGCECRSRHEADAGSRNPNIFSGKLFLICSPGTPAELVGAKPLHLANARPFCRLKAPLGLSLLRNRGHSGAAFSRVGSWRKTAAAAPASCGSGGAAGKHPRPLSQALSGLPALPKGEPLAKPEALSFNRKLFRHAKGSPFGRAVTAGD